MKKILPLMLTILIAFSGCSAKKSAEKPDSGEIVIALLDTGVASAAIKSDRLLAGYNYITETSETEDLINHGTAVASAILGCESAEITGGAPNAYIVPLVIVTKQDGQTVSAPPEKLAQAILDSTDRYGADIINVSLGTQKDSKALSDAVSYAENKGVLVVSAVGNDGADGEPYYPAAYETVVAVGSCDKNGKQSEFSQSGADALAQGEDILLASRNGAKYSTKGTSFATGIVSAAAAVFLAEDKSLSPAELREKITEKQYFQIN